MPPGGASGGFARRGTVEERKAAADERRERRASVTDLSTVIEAAAGYLALRPRTVDEMRRRLHHLGYRGDLCDRAVDRLVELGYLDDDEYARAWVERRDRSRPRGELALKRELRARGLPEASIEAALRGRAAAGASADADAEPADGPPSDGAGRGDEQAAWRLVERRRSSLMREPDPRKRKQKAYALLARNGFDPDLCQRVASVLLSEDAPV